MRGADGVKTAVLRKGLAKLTFIRAAAHAHVSLDLKIQAMKIIALFGRSFLRALGFLPFIGDPVKIINLNQKIKSFEKQGRFEEARTIRKDALVKISPTYHGPLLRSEGDDKLYQLKDYEGALEAFEKAILAMEKSPFLYGVTSPDSVYAGAAQAAVYLGLKEKAKKYYQSFKELFGSLKKNPKLQHSLEWHKETLKWLEYNINKIS